MSIQLPQISIEAATDPSTVTVSTPPTQPDVPENTPYHSLLTRFHAGYFRISISICSQAMLWKTLDEKSSHPDALERLVQKLPSTAFLVLWSIALLTISILTLLYTLKCVFHFSKVLAEFRDHIGINYFFAPWVSWLLLLQSSPFGNPKGAYHIALWFVFTIPILTLDVKIYGQWFADGKRILQVVANPTCQITVIANLVAARAAARIGWMENATCLFSLGLVHYMVLFITLYQRFLGSESLRLELRPVFFLFFAAPSMGSLAWYSISGTFNTGSKMLFFLSLFLFTSLVARPIYFLQSMKKYNVAWWAYSFPLTFMALASAEYAQQVKGRLANGLMFVLSAISVVVTLALIVVTALNSNMLLK